MSDELVKRIISSVILIPITLYIVIQGSNLFNLFLITSLFLSCREWFLIVNKKIYYFLGFLFLLFSYLSIYSIRNNFGESSLNFFLIIFLICVLTDIGGYIFGKLFKGPKLTKISPKKTYSGMIGSFIFSIVGLFIFVNYSIYLDFKSLEFDLNFFFFVLLISSISQLGDITISYFKRLSNINDTGNIIPGHGGILDRTDGMIFSYPFAYLLLKFNLLLWKKK